MTLQEKIALNRNGIEKPEKIQVSTDNQTANIHDIKPKEITEIITENNINQHYLVESSSTFAQLYKQAKPIDHEETKKLIQHNIDTGLYDKPRLPISEVKPEKFMKEVTNDLLDKEGIRDFYSNQSTYDVNKRIEKSGDAINRYLGNSKDLIVESYIKNIQDLAYTKMENIHQLEYKNATQKNDNFRLGLPDGEKISMELLVKRQNVEKAYFEYQENRDLAKLEKNNPHDQKIYKDKQTTADLKVAESYADFKQEKTGKQIAYPERIKEQKAFLDKPKLSTTHQENEIDMGGLGGLSKKINVNRLSR